MLFSLAVISLFAFTILYYIYKERQSSLKELAQTRQSTDTPSLSKKNEHLIQELEKSIQEGLAQNSVLDREKNGTDTAAKSTLSELSKPLPLPPKNIDLEKITDEKSVVSEVKEEIKPAKPPVRFDTTKPKLVLIIDDVSYDYQMKSILNIDLAITPSILPPTKRHPNSDKIAKIANEYMVHLPLEAMDFNSPEDKTLKVGDSAETIEKRIREIKTMFPSVRYINGHTGSKFTSDLGSMEKLLTILKKYGIHYIDSRTTPYTKADEAAKELGLHISKRDVFIDNKRDEKYILNQLKEAIYKAKKNGFAIAIGHPHKETLETIKKHIDIFDDLEVMYATDIPKLLNM